MDNTVQGLTFQYWGTPVRFMLTACIPAVRLYFCYVRMNIWLIYNTASSYSRQRPNIHGYICSLIDIFNSMLILHAWLMANAWCMFQISITIYVLLLFSFSLSVWWVGLNNLNLCSDPLGWCMSLIFFLSSLLASTLTSWISPKTLP